MDISKKNASLPRMSPAKTGQAVRGTDATRTYSFVLCLLACFIISCKSNKEEETVESEGTPVTITNVSVGDIEDFIEVNAVSSFLVKSVVKSNVTGYVVSVNTSQGDYVGRGKTLFVIRTKEAQGLGNLINELDSAYHFRGTTAVIAPSSGYITQLANKPGAFVQEGDQLAVINDINSFYFLLDLPYELRPYVPPNSRYVEVTLPDGTVLPGHISEAMPTVDMTSQTQSFKISVKSPRQLPENLIGKAKLYRKSSHNAYLLPKAAVLTDETQSEFWVMKLIDDSTAVKVEIEKGLETKDNVEIVNPALNPSDRIVLTGNYGLTDTAKVVVVNE